MHTKSSKGKEIRIPGPDHLIIISPTEGKIRVTVAGRVVAESARVLQMEERGDPPVYYLPQRCGHVTARSDQALHLLSGRGRDDHC